MTDHNAARIAPTPDVDRITYEISRHLPEIRDRGCTISTAYSDLMIEPHEAAPIARAVENTLERRLRVARLAARPETIAEGANICGEAPV